MSNKVDAVAHHEKSKINNELEALRKLHLAQNLRRKASANILENLSKNQMNTRQASGTENKFAQSNNKPTSAYVGDSWAMQQKARAEEEKRKRQEARSFLTGYRSNATDPSSPVRPERKKHVDEAMNYGTSGLDEFTMKQKALAEEEKEKRREAESNLRSYKPSNSNKSPVISPSPSWDNETEQEASGTPRAKVGGIINFFSKRKLKESDQLKKTQSTFKFKKKQEKHDIEANTNSKHGNSQSPTSVVSSNLILGSISQAPDHNSKQDKNESTTNVQQLRNQFDKHEENAPVLRKTIQKKISNHQLGKETESESATSVGRKKTMVPNFNLEIYVEFHTNPQSKKHSKLGAISETWQIHFIYTIFFSSKRMNEVSLRSHNIKEIFEKRFGDVGMTLIKDAVDESSDDKLSYEISSFSSRATNPSVIDSFNKKEPIKVLVQANLDIERSNDYDNVTFQTTMSRAFRGATVKGTSLALDDIH